MARLTPETDRISPVLSPLFRSLFVMGWFPERSYSSFLFVLIVAAINFLRAGEVLLLTCLKTLAKALVRNFVCGMVIQVISLIFGN